MWISALETPTEAEIPFRNGDVVVVVTHTLRMLDSGWT